MIGKKRSKKKVVGLGINDADGTSFDGNLTMELFKDLIQKGIISKEMSDEIFSYYGKYKKSDEAGKLILLDKIYRLFAGSLKGKKESEIRTIAEETFSRVSDKVFSSSEPLVRSLKKNGFKVILMSGSMMEMVRILGRYLNIDEQDIIAGKLEIKRGIYTGRVISYVSGSDQKVKEINRYSRDNNLVVDWPHTFAIGNDERDLAILKKAGVPFLFKPKGKLKTKAIKFGFYIVNQNNVIKTLNNVMARRV